MKRDKLPPDKIIMEQLEKFGFDKKAVSKVLPGLVKIFENPNVKEEVQELINTKEFQALRKTIEKITKKKEEIPEAVNKAKEHIKDEEKESPWKTAFGVVGWGILLFLVLFMLAELKGVDYLSGQAAGKKK